MNAFSASVFSGLVRIYCAQAGRSWSTEGSVAAWIRPGRRCRRRTFHLTKWAPSQRALVHLYMYHALLCPDSSLTDININHYLIYSVDLAHYGGSEGLPGWFFSNEEHHPSLQSSLSLLKLSVGSVWLGLGSLLSVWNIISLTFLSFMRCEHEVSFFPSSRFRRYFPAHFILLSPYITY